MLLGCNTVLFAGTDLDTALTHLAWAGYRYVELAAIRGMAEHVRSDMDRVDAQRIRETVTNHGLQVTAMEVGVPDRSRLEPLLSLAEEIGVPIVNIGSGGTTGDDESVKRATSMIAELAELASQHGVRLAVKPHVGQAIHDSTTGLRLMEEVEHPALGLNFDPSHLYRANENPEEVATVWGSRIVTSHFRDSASRAQRVGPPETQIPGRGSVNIPATLGALHRSGYAGPLNLEVIGAGDYEIARAMGVAAESRGYLNRCLQELGIAS